MLHFAHIIVLFEDGGHVSIFHAAWEAAGLNKTRKRIC